MYCCFLWIDGNGRMSYEKTQEEGVGLNWGFYSEHTEQMLTKPLMSVVSPSPMQSGQSPFEQLGHIWTGPHSKHLVHPP
jgi:hypothetical protein